MTEAPVEVPGADPSGPRASPNSDEVRAEAEERRANDLDAELRRRQAGAHRDASPVRVGNVALQVGASPAPK